jgi:hypothetical protein
MNSNLLLLAILVGIASGDSLSAQRTWIVDAKNGPGTQFTTVAAAVAAAANGDLLSIRPGHYTKTKTISKALTFQGTAPGVRIAPVATRTSPSVIQVGAIGRGRTIAFRDVALTYVILNRVAGTVVFDGVQILDPQNGGIWSQDGAVIAIRNSKIVGGVVASGTGAFSGRIFVVRSEIVGQTEDLTARPPQPATPGISVFKGELSLTESTVRGGQAKLASSPAGITAFATRVLIRGLGSKVAAGTLNKGGNSAMRGDSLAVALHDRNVVFAPNGTHAPIAGFRSVRYHALPSLTAGTLSAGARWNFELRSLPGSNYAVAVSLPGSGVAMPFGEALMLNMSFAQVLAVGRQSATGVAKLSLVIPSTLRTQPHTFAMQGLQSISGRFELTNPIVIGQR